MKLMMTVFCLLFVTNIKFLNADDSTKVVMRDVFENYLKLIPYTYSDKQEKFKNIDKHLIELEKSFFKAKHDSMLRRAYFSPLVGIVQESISDIRKIHKKNYHQYAKMRIKKIMSVCISCHSFLPNQQYERISVGYNDLLRKYIKTNYDKAMVAYFLRDYKKALNYLKIHLENGIKNKSISFEREEVSKVILGLYLRDMKDAMMARNYFASLLKRNIFNKDMRGYVSRWISDLDKEARKKESKNLSEKRLKTLLDRELLPIEAELRSFSNRLHAVTSFKFKGYLSNYIVNHSDSKLMPEALYWLGLIENQGNDLYLYSLGDLYLKECVKKYFDSQIAPKCFSAYRESMMNAYTGSSGTHLPSDVTNELKKMEKLISTKN